MHSTCKEGLAYWTSILWPCQKTAIVKTEAMGSQWDALSHVTDMEFKEE
jgi:hypothetical protein